MTVRRGRGAVAVVVAVQRALRSFSAAFRSAFNCRASARADATASTVTVGPGEETHFLLYFSPATSGSGQ
ncbi:hypothetical protein ACFYMW_38825 [Streptomyces sp. NPDC006692]|uniref:hypothetical protein n=1 Tax=unclassified Streptomyces TaxID=2593676 RepID=UPI0036A5D18F